MLVFVLTIIILGFFIGGHPSEWHEEEEVRCDLPSIKMPPRGSNPAFGVTLKVASPNYWGSGLKWFYKGQLKNEPLYHQRIELDPPTEGIPISTIGDWIFGVPAYEGNVRFLANQGEIEIQVPLDAPKEVITLLAMVFPEDTQIISGMPHSVKVLGPAVDEEYIIQADRRTRRHGLPDRPFGFFINLEVDRK